MTEFWLCFVPLFAAMDPIGILPLFLTLTEDLDKEKVHRVILQSTLTAAGVSLAFLAIGKIVLDLLGITFADFMIAGGTLLFVLSIGDMLSFEKKTRVTDHESLGAVPLGVPLIVGPAVLATTLLLVNEHGTVPTIAAIVANIVVTGIMFNLAKPISRTIGKAGEKTISKLANLILAAIGVMLVRRGIGIFISQGF